MAYNSGVSTLFNKSVNMNSAYADSINPAFSFSGSINSLFGSYINPSVSINSTGSIVNLYCQSISTFLSQPGGTISQFNNLMVNGPLATAGAITNAYSLYVVPFSGSGTVVNNFTAYFQGSIGIGTTTPVSALDVAGTMSVGTYAGTITSTVSQLVISGYLGIATATPSYIADVNGIAAARQMFSPQTTRANQLAAYTLGFDQNLGGGLTNTNKGLNTLSCSVFNIQTNVSNSSNGYYFATYDGRYVYLGPQSNSTFTRYDTFISFSSSLSYQVYNLNNVVNSITGSLAIGFDGMFVYLQVAPGYFLKYNTSSPFTFTTSYQVFNLLSLNGSASLYFGAIFDGTYVYISGNASTTPLIRYNTNLPFTVSTSYQVFVNPPSAVGSGANGYYRGSFDGRYIYFVPQSTSTAAVYNLVRYDTFSSFSVSASYTAFNAVSLGGNTPVQMSGVVNTGRYIYFIPFNATTVPGQIIQYDTTSSFTSSSSYRTFNITPFYTAGASPQSSAFDGRYLYLMPWNSTLIVRYDTLLPFTTSTSYVFTDLSLVLGASNTFLSAIFNGRYLFTSAASAGLFYRIDVYPGPQATYLNAFSAPLGLTLLNGGGLNLVGTSTSGSAISGTASAVPAQVAQYLVVNINGTSRKIPFYNQ